MGSIAPGQLERNSSDQGSASAKVPPKLTAPLAPRTHGAADDHRYYRGSFLGSALRARGRLLNPCHADYRVLNIERQHVLCPVGHALDNEPSRLGGNDPAG